jgi:hypothetical protein
MAPCVHVSVVTSPLSPSRVVAAQRLAVRIAATAFDVDIASMLRPRRCAPFGDLFPDPDRVVRHSQV